MSKNCARPSRPTLPPEAESEIMAALSVNMEICSDEIAAILKKHGVSGNEDALQDSYRKRLGQHLMASIRDDKGKREVLANGRGRYVVLEGCGDRQQLQTIYRRINSQMKGLNESSDKVQARISVLDRLKARLSPRKQKKRAA